MYMVFKAAVLIPYLILLALVLSTLGCSTSTWQLTEVPAIIKPSTYYPKEWLKSAEYRGHNHSQQEDYMRRVELGLPVEHHPHLAKLRMRRSDIFDRHDSQTIHSSVTPHAKVRVFWGAGENERWRNEYYFDSKLGIWKKYENELDYRRRK